MEQRQLRLGDIVDDYCPRERRLTNHAIVAILQDEIKQTRCTTCDAEHPYKGARVPPRRVKKGAALYEQVLASAAPDHGAGPAAAPSAPATPAAQKFPETAVHADGAGNNNGSEDPVAPAEDGPVHRPLIRATLPRPEGQVPVRPLPEFTIRQSSGRNGNVREDPRSPSRGGRPPRPHSGQMARPQGQRDGRAANSMHGSQGRPKFAQRGGRPQDRQQQQPRHQRPHQGRPGPKRSK
jgi:hypothetical protein